MVILTGRLVDAIHVDWPYEMVFCDRQAIRMPINLAGSSEDDLRGKIMLPARFEQRKLTSAINFEIGVRVIHAVDMAHLSG